jgi:hypothetical protein
MGAVTKGLLERSSASAERDRGLPRQIDRLAILANQLQITLRKLNAEIGIWSHCDFNHWPILQEKVTFSPANCSA